MSIQRGILSFLLLRTLVTTTSKDGDGGGETMGKKKDRTEELRQQMHEFEVSSFGGDGLML